MGFEWADLLMDRNWELVWLSHNTTLRPAVRWRSVGFLLEAQIGASPYGLPAGKTVPGLGPSDRAISEWKVRLSVASLTRGLPDHS